MAFIVSRIDCRAVVRNSGTYLDCDLWNASNYFYSYCWLMHMNSPLDFNWTVSFQPSEFAKDYHLNFCLVFGSAVLYRSDHRSDEFFKVCCACATASYFSPARQGLHIDYCGNTLVVATLRVDRRSSGSYCCCWLCGVLVFEDDYSVAAL